MVGAADGHQYFELWMQYFEFTQLIEGSAQGSFVLGVISLPVNALARSIDSLVFGLVIVESGMSIDEIRKRVKDVRHPFGGPSPFLVVIAITPPSASAP